VTRPVRPTGILLVDKPVGPTSHDVVAAVRRALGTRRVGHFGTLDPFATGLLACGVGPATRLASHAAAHVKTYAATFRLGWTSSTDDVEGDLASVDGAIPPDRATVERALAGWIGAVEQTPPIFSAKHLAGERAHARARRGEPVVLQPVTVEIRSIDLQRYAWPDLELRVECGPGTYIRALARDFGETLGTGGYCHALRRLRSGPFEVGAAIAWDELGPAALAALRPAAEAVADLPRIELGPVDAGAAVSGRAVPAGELRASGWVALFGPGGFLGLGEAVEGLDGTWVRPRRILYPEGEGW
jgi:tRNA pseudouridine55 synthase